MIKRWLAQASPTVFAAYCIVAAFCTYFCMYAFRKPFNAAEFKDLEWLGVDYKIILLIAQTLGYTFSKFIGIKVISEMTAARRAVGIVVLVILAEVALLAFALVPRPYNFTFLFINGLPLGMVFGLVMSFLEGRRFSEALTAGLCASFIVASGVMKSVGRWLIEVHGVDEFWMPFIAGAIFLGPLLFFVAMLNQIPVPTAEDVEKRSVRAPMTSVDRWAFFKRHALGLSCLLLIYIFLTVLRDFRDGFGVEIWKSIAPDGKPEIYAKSEILIAIVVTAVCGATMLIRNNRVALFSALATIGVGLVIVGVATLVFQGGAISGFTWMVLGGLGFYIPYVIFHTTLFERLIATFKDKSNIGYLMYLADAVGYLGSVGILLYKNFGAKNLSYKDFFIEASYVVTFVCLILLIVAWRYFSRQSPAK
tara:strand:+ start:1750 stop:3012 length:1263 start_codon:yes stop_codon:yes gene_type:complete